MGARKMVTVPEGKSIASRAGRQLTLMRKALSGFLIALAAFLLLWRLDAIPLWRDETTTANWGRLLAESGVWAPRVFDGEQLIAQAADGHDFNSKLLPAMHSWLQFYVAGIGFKLLGVGTFTARLPFVLIGAACLFVLYRIGQTLFDGGLSAFLPPSLALLSIHFLSPARQSRYYILVVLFASLLLLEFCRYLRDPDRAAQRSFYVRLGVYGTLLYLSNYVSFAGTWASLGIFVLCLGDRRLLRGFVAVSGVLVVVLGFEFWMLHSEFASSWPPPGTRSSWDLWRSGLTSRIRDYWRMIPFVLLLPAASYLFFRRARVSSPLTTGALLLAALIALSPLLLNYGTSELGQFTAGGFWSFAVLCIALSAFLLWRWSRLDLSGVWPRAALMGALILVVSPLLTIAAVKNQANTRHFLQVLPAAFMLGAIAVAAIERTAGRKAAIAFFAGLLIWPNLNWRRSGAEQVLERQYLADDSYNGPVLRYLEEHLEPGDRVAFLRNVKGMAFYFYLPEMRWVGLLDSDAPHNQQFRGRIPDDQFDDSANADWYVIWDPKREQAKGLDESYEKVWEHAYKVKVPWWDRHRPPGDRKYEVYRRKPATAQVGP